MSIEEVTDAVSTQTNRSKYKLLEENYKPYIDFIFQKTFNRSFQHRWLEEYPWLVYSKAVNGEFCKFCALFAKNRAKLGVLVNKPFTTWVNVHKIVDGYASNTYRTIEDALDFQHSIESHN